MRLIWSVPGLTFRRKGRVQGCKEACWRYKDPLSSALSDLFCESVIVMWLMMGFVKIIVRERRSSCLERKQILFLLKIMG